jgi:hypothetical protein
MLRALSWGLQKAELRELKLGQPMVFLMELSLALQLGHCWGFPMARQMG